MAKNLVVEDDTGVRDVIVRILRQDGHRVTVTEDGAHGLEALETDPFDLVVTDV